MVLLRIVAAVLLVAHGLVHLLYLAHDVREFSLDQSWLVPQRARRPLALGLIVATVAAFTILALAVLGIPGLLAAWPGLTVLACTLSMVLLILFWNRWLVFGLSIDIALLALAVIRPGWLEQFVSQR